MIIRIYLNYNFGSAQRSMYGCSGESSYAEPLQLANNAKDMSRLDLNVIYEIIRPCGLAPQKSAQ